ncbi:MAG: NUDIX domain-containing protein [bacterium]
MKVYLNDRIIHFTDTRPDTITAGDMFIVCDTRKQMKKAFREFESDPAIRHLYLQFQNDEHKREIMDDFLALFKIVEAAGGVVKNDYGEILFIHRLGYWDLPKGKISKRDRKIAKDKSDKKILDAGCRMQDPDYARIAAVREVQEETGLIKLTVNEELAETWHIYSRGGNKILKRTYWFGMFADVLQTLTPQAEEDIVEAKWISPSEFSDIREKCYASLRELF